MHFTARDQKEQFWPRRKRRQPSRQPSPARRPRPRRRPALRPPHARLLPRSPSPQSPRKRPRASPLRRKPRRRPRTMSSSKTRTLRSMTSLMTMPRSTTTIWTLTTSTRILTTLTKTMPTTKTSMRTMPTTMMWKTTRTRKKPSPRHPSSPRKRVPTWSPTRMMRKRTSSLRAIRSVV